jgi:tetratricopeptide (TPR) repeat protein
VAARCLSRLDSAEQAEPYYRRALFLSAEDEHYRAYGLVRANLHDRAVGAYREILRRRPGDVTALRMEAGVLLSQGRWNDVLAVARQLTAIPPGSVPFYLPVTVAGGHWSLRLTEVASAPVIGYTLDGLVHHDLTTTAADVLDRDVHETGAAAAAFERVLALDPGLRSVPLEQSLFWAYFIEDLLRLGRSADAVRHLSQAAEDKDDPGLMELLGRSYAQQGSLDDAERCWKKALERDPNRFTAWLNLGRLELQRDRPGEAVRLLDRAAGIEPGSYETAYSLSQAYRRLGREGEARRYQEKADRLRSDDPKGRRGP